MGFCACAGEDSLASSGEDPSASTQLQVIEASPPPPYLVSALPSISFTAHQDHIMQNGMVIDELVVIRDDEKMV